MFGGRWGPKYCAKPTNPSGASGLPTNIAVICGSQIFFDWVQASLMP